VVTRLEGLANGHPYQPEKISQGALRILKTLSECLIEITGMEAITLQPAAGAQGELTGLLLVRGYLQSKGNPRKKILIPDSAHGTNPATAATVGDRKSTRLNSSHVKISYAVFCLKKKKNKKKQKVDSR